MSDRIEVPCHPLKAEEFKGTSGVRKLYNKLVKNGFDIVRFTGARGPILTATGQDTERIGDSVVLIAVHKITDDCVIATWFEGSKGALAFEWARVGNLRKGYYYGYRVMNSTEVGKWLDAGRPDPVGWEAS